jgi:NADH-quinone oxidoreductase subunit G
MSKDKIEITINDKKVEVEQGITLIQACETAGVEIPRFCYHDRLSIAGNCRMCLVEVVGGPPKPVASCAMNVAAGMQVKTDSPMVKKAREGVMEFLLANHPLDCPICDQGGECDLQDQAMTYGRDKSRFTENKRAVKEKNFGPLIKTQMTRCIHCTRCVRFATEIAGVEEIGAIGRGETMEIATYVEKSISSELSGNMIDLCPVGALTAKPHAFKFRPWELNKTESIDVLDAVGSNIRIDSRGMEVMRILPRLNEEINEEWIDDKARFACDGLKSQRLDKPYLKVDGRLQTVSMQEALDALSNKFNEIEGDKAKKIAALAGNLADVEAVFALKTLMQKIGSAHMDCRPEGSIIDSKNRSSYIFNTSIAGIEESDLCLLIGTNPRLEAAILNARLRKRYLKGGFTIANIGKANDLTYKVEELGNNLQIISEIASGKHEFAKKLKSAKKPMIVIGEKVFSREDALAIAEEVNNIIIKYNITSKDWNGYNLLHNAAGRVGALDVGFTPASKGKDTKAIIADSKNGKIELLFLLSADDNFALAASNKAFTVYIGSHGDIGAHHADLILPSAAYTEKDVTYVNIEGCVQKTSKAIEPLGEAKADWQVIKEIAEILEIDLGFKKRHELDEELLKQYPNFANLNRLSNEKWVDLKGKKGKIAAQKLTNNINNFYMTDPISRASQTMAKCSDAA